jgi:cell division protein FtsI (penicillin-binding protein 3)
MEKKIIIVCIALLNCIYLRAEEPQKIDNSFNLAVTKILENELTEINGISGQAIVMDTKTGKICSEIRLVRKGKKYICDNRFDIKEPSGLIRPISLFAALQTGNIKMTDSVDTGCGMMPIGNNFIKDHNWRRGGYGKISYEGGLMFNSNIAVIKAVEQAYKNNFSDYYATMNKWGFTGNAVDTKSKYDLALSCIGHKSAVSSMQLLNFYNHIANNNGEVSEQAAIKSLKSAMERNIIEGLGQVARTKKVKMAVVQGTEALPGKIKNKEYIIDFCGYFPIDNPQYTVIVSIKKTGLPASGEMAGNVLRQIAETVYK